MEIVGRTRPTRMLEDTSWWENSSLPGKKIGGCTAKVVSIKPCGRRILVDLQTSEKTFLCEGLVSHNSTFIQAWQYEQCDRNNLRTSMTVSYDTDSTKEMFQKAKMIHGHSWFPHKAKRDSRGVVELVNESTFYTRTAGNTRVGRSQTIHHCHCSEIPMWDDPAEALTSLTACVPVSPDSSLLYESTAKGAVGEFYQAWRDASRGESDMVPFFAPWFWDPEYKLGFPSEDHRRKFGRDLGHKDRRYMERHSLSLEQMRWRQKKIQGYSGSIRRFRQEFPAEPMEAFLTTGSPAFDPDAVQELASNTTQPYFQGDIVIER